MDLVERMVWRSYWKRKVIPDGLVQRRINQFSAMLPEIGGGEVSTNGRKRKFARDGKWIYTSAANFRILGLEDIIIILTFLFTSHQWKVV